MTQRRLVHTGRRRPWAWGLALAALLLAGACGDGAGDTTTELRTPTSAPVSTQSPPSTLARLQTTAPAAAGPADTSSASARGFIPPPEGLSRVGIVEALGGRLEEGRAAVYPDGFVETCWDVVFGVYHLFVTDPGAIDLAALDPHLGGAPIEVVASRHERAQLEAWEEQAQEALQQRSITASANVSVVVVEWPNSDRFCAPQPYLSVVVHNGADEADVTAALSDVPPDVIAISYGPQSQLLPGGGEQP